MTSPRWSFMRYTPGRSGRLSRVVWSSGVTSRCYRENDRTRVRGPGPDDRGWWTSGALDDAALDDGCDRGVGGDVLDRDLEQPVARLEDVGAGAQRRPAVP